MNISEYIIPIIILFVLINGAAFIRLRLFSTLSYKSFKKVLLISNVLLLASIVAYLVLVE